MIAEQKVLQHSKERCYVGITIGVIVSLIKWDIAPVLIGSIFSIASIIEHIDLKRLIRKELKRQIN